MGRPEPLVLFAQTIVHSQLDEYVDEVLFSEPVVITACEFLEQNASASTPNISLVGATSPPSFALEVFVHCEGESRFRRLCQPFLYSHSTSNVLEVEAIVTNHLVLRGTYRSLTLVIYGNTAEDLGQFNIELDLDNSLANVVSSPSEGKLEDLPPALHSSKLTFEESLSSLKPLSFRATESDLPPEAKQILLLILKIYQISHLEDIVPNLGSAVTSAVSKCARASIKSKLHWWDQELASCFTESNVDSQEISNIFIEARDELREMWKNLHSVTGSSLFPDDADFAFGPEGELPTAKYLVELFARCFPYFSSSSVLELSCPSQNERSVFVLSLILLLCSSRESCFHFVKAGGMNKLINLICHETPKSSATTLLLLGIIEHSTRSGVGCEAFLGWWPRCIDSGVPIRSSVGYCFLLKLLLETERHDIASLSTYMLQRLRFYEILSRYESAVVKVFTDLPADGGLSTDGASLLIAASAQLAEISQLINLCGPMEDSSPEAYAQRILTSGHLEDLLSYKATINFIKSSKHSFALYDVDPYFLSLLKERGFFLLSAALLSSSILRFPSGSATEILLEIASSIESIILSLLFCRSGLSFLLSQPEATELIVLALQHAEDMSKTECITLRQASVLLSKGFFCRPQEIGLITELHLKVGSAASKLLAVAPNSDELLWVLWELCAVSRSDSGRQALLALGYFPEAVSVLLSSLSSYQDLDPAVTSFGGSPLGLAIFHSAAEILEVLVADSTASSLKSWIGLAIDLHKALHSSSPGSNRKDAPTRLLEWIDAGVIYQRNGAVGLLRYSAVLASGGDAHLSSANVLVSDSIDVENVVADSSNSSDGHVIDNLLGKFVADKYFDGVVLRSTSVVQLTTCFRILASISEDSAVASSLFEEGAITLIYVVLVNCKSMLERMSNSYDYLVDEGAELSSTTDLLLDRTHEQALVDLMIPSLVLLKNLLHKLHETKEQYRNKKLLNALLQLHREVSPKLAACAADLSFLYPSFALSFGVVCHLITSALACWPLYNWAPGLFHCLLENVEATSASIPLGPKDACSLLCLLGDLFPDEGLWLWKNEIPSISAIRALSIGTVLGPQLEREANWYLDPEHVAVLLVRLMPQLDRIARVIENFATSALMVIQDMLRVFIVRVASEKIECAVVLLRPIFAWLNEKVDEVSLSEREIFKVHQLLNFVASLSEHPNAKALLLKMGAVRILWKLLQRCSNADNLEEKMTLENAVHATNIAMLSWRIPVFRSLALIFSTQSSMEGMTTIYEPLNENACIEECSSIIRHLLKLCQVLPVGKEMLACALAFKEVVSSNMCKSALSLMFSQIQSSKQEEQQQDERDADGSSLNEDNWQRFSPMLKCWRRLLAYFDANHQADYLVETIYALTIGAIALTLYDDNLEGIIILKSLFGLPCDWNNTSDSKLKEIICLMKAFEEKIDQHGEKLPAFVGKSILQQVKGSTISLCSLLQSSSGFFSDSERMVVKELYESPAGVIRSVTMTARLMPSLATVSVNDEAALFFSNAWKVIINAEEVMDCQESEFSKKLVWELPDSSLDRQLMPGQSAKRKLALGEGTGRRTRDSQVPEAAGQFSRGPNTTNASVGPTRRDTFRQRKPNTSRPPSMHVDDYVARERHIDGASSGSNIVSSTVRGTLSGRPPSIHVDEFMARQRERQNSTPTPVGDAPQVKNQTLLDDNDSHKPEKPQQPKADINDDQEIDIVFDEESGSDDKLPFPQPDDSLQSPPVIIGENSPVPVIEETEADQNERSQFCTPLSKDDESFRSDVSSRRTIVQEANVILDKKSSVPGPGKKSFHDHDEKQKYVSTVGSRGSDTFPSTSVSGFPSPLRNVHSAQISVHQLPSSVYQKKSPPKFGDSSMSSGFQTQGERKLPNNQPPLPPMPPPVPSMPSQNSDPLLRQSSFYGARDVQPPLPSGYPLQSFDAATHNTLMALQFQSENILGSSSGSSSNALLNTESKFVWNPFPGSRLPLENFSSSSSARAMPPLPPPYSTSAAQLAVMNSGSPASLYNHASNVGTQPCPPASLISDASLGINTASCSALASHSLPSYAQPLFINRPSLHGSIFGSPLQQAQLSSGLPQNIPNSQPSISLMQPRPPPPPPPPQQPHPSQPHQQPGSLQLQQQQQSLSYPESSIQVQMPLQFPNQIPPQLQYYYQSQQESVAQPLRQVAEQVQPQNQSLQADSLSQQQDSGISLQQYFSSPEAIQSLLSDRDKLCQLLEQHPKLMQMLQERLGQL